MLADPLRVDRGRSGTGPGRHHKRAGLGCFEECLTPRTHGRSLATAAYDHAALVAVQVSQQIDGRSSDREPKRDRAY
ncbi:hypothetical protein REMIM1_PE00112 (plasmid) [Rhizobium etli bv. mimosae str. Mim1]|nr:hypothetical protein REMIM1_PE00112 [Rhizobium etli bv. mimosae str. Mim1]